MSTEVFPNRATKGVSHTERSDRTPAVLARFAFMLVAALFLGLIGMVIWRGACAFGSGHGLDMLEVRVLVGSLVASFGITVVAFAVATPLAFGCAVRSTEQGHDRTMRVALIASRFLASVPGVVLGLLASVCAHALGNLLAAGIALGLLILPRLLWDFRRALYRVPVRDREAALALGATHATLFSELVWHLARRELTSVILRHASVAVGASACILLVPWEGQIPLPAMLFAQATERSAHEGSTVATLGVLLLTCLALQAWASRLAPESTP